MRPRFAIYFAAGLALAFALWMAVAHAMGAYTGHDLLTLFRPGEDTQRVRDTIEAHYSEIAFALILALLQGVIIFCTRRLSRENQWSNETR
jgi:hypothetical protein